MKNNNADCPREEVLYIWRSRDRFQSRGGEYIIYGQSLEIFETSISDNQSGDEVSRVDSKQQASNRFLASVSASGDHKRGPSSQMLSMQATMD